MSDTDTVDQIASGFAKGEPRQNALRRALRLEYITVGWNVVEGVIAIWSAIAAGSVALLGFGIDSFVESASGLILVWRLLVEYQAKGGTSIEQNERRATRLVALSLFGLAGYITFDATLTLWKRERPETTFVGIALTGLSLCVMMFLARAKQRAAAQLGSRALAADAFQTTACWWLSMIVLVGIGLNAILGWWWADPIAALGAALFIIREGREVWRGQDCC